MRNNDACNYQVSLISSFNTIQTSQIVEENKKNFNLNIRYVPIICYYNLRFNIYRDRKIVVIVNTYK